MIRWMRNNIIFAVIETIQTFEKNSHHRALRVLVITVVSDEYYSPNTVSCFMADVGRRRKERISPYAHQAGILIY